MAKEQEFLQLIATALDACDRAVREATTSGEIWMIEDASTARVQFEKIAEQVRSETLRPSQGSGLGITRALSEWGAPTYLYEAGEAVEEFYTRNW